MGTDKAKAKYCCVCVSICVYFNGCSTGDLNLDFKYVLSVHLFNHVQWLNCLLTNVQYHMYVFA